MKIFRILAAGLVASAGVSSAAVAQTVSAVDYSSLTGAIDWTPATVAMLAVGALLAAVMVVYVGVGFVLKMISGR